MSHSVSFRWVDSIPQDVQYTFHLAEYFSAHCMNISFTACTLSLLYFNLASAVQIRAETTQTPMEASTLRNIKIGLFVFWSLYVCGETVFPNVDCFAFDGNEAKTRSVQYLIMSGADVLQAVLLIIVGCWIYCYAAHSDSVNSAFFLSPNSLLFIRLKCMCVFFFARSPCFVF